MPPPPQQLSIPSSIMLELLQYLLSSVGIQSVQIHYFLKNSARPKGFLLYSKTTKREVMVKHDSADSGLVSAAIANSEDGISEGGPDGTVDMAKKMVGESEENKLVVLSFGSYMRRRARARVCVCVCMRLCVGMFV